MQTQLLKKIIVSIFSIFMIVTTLTINSSAIDDTQVKIAAQEKGAITIVSQPKDVSGVLNAKVNVSVEATGSSLKYQWQYRKNSNIGWSNSTFEGCTTSTMKIEVTKAREGYQYRCKLTSGSNIVYTNIITLHVKPKITMQPTSVLVYDGSKAIFEVAADGVNLAYQWQYRKNEDSSWANTSMEGNKTNTLKVDATKARGGYQYRCVISNGNIKVYSKAANLAVIGAPVIITQPSNITVEAGKKATFRVEARGLTLSYQWQYRKNTTGSWADTTMTGNRTANLTVDASKARDGYQYRCIIKEEGILQTISKVATLTVLYTPEIITQPTNQRVEVDQTAIFKVEASGNELQYQWQLSKDGGSSWLNSSQPGNKTNKLQLKGTLSWNGYVYRCKVMSGTKIAYSNKVKLAVTSSTTTSKPIITTQPKNITALEGDYIEFSIKATGTSLKYQWQYSRDGGKTWANNTFATSTTNSMLLEATKSRNGFMYRCKVTSGATSIYSNAVTLTVKLLPRITRQPVNVTVNQGSNAVFTITATGDDICYLWQYYDGRDWKVCTESSATTNKLTIKATKTMNGYEYRCIVYTDDYNLVSDNAMLMVNVN